MHLKSNQIRGRFLPQVVYHRAGNESGSLGTEESEDLKLTYLLCWLTCVSVRLGWRVLRESLLKLGAVQTGRTGRKVDREDLGDLLAERGRRRGTARGLLLRWDEGGWIWRRGGSSKGLQFDYLLPWPVWLMGSQGMPAALGRRDTAMNGEKRLEGKTWVLHWRRWQGGRRGCRTQSVTELFPKPVQSGVDWRCRCDHYKWLLILALYKWARVHVQSSYCNKTHT